MNVISPGPSRASYHTLARGMRCLRSYRIAQEIEKELGSSATSNQTKPMQQGSLVHVGLAHVYLYLWADELALRTRAGHKILIANEELTDPTEYAPWQRAVYDSAADFDLSGEEVSEIVSTLRTYEVQVARTDKHQFDLISIENEYEYYLKGVPEGKELRTQRADLVLYERRTGKYFIVDHKKVWRLSNITEEQFLPHGQFIGYSIIGRKLYGSAFGGVILNRVCLQGPRFDRTIINHSKEVIMAFIASMKETLWRLDAYKDKSWRETPGVFDEQVCKGKYESCPFMKMCIGIK